MTQLAINDLLKGRPLHSANPAAVDEESGSAFQVESVSLSKIAADFGIRGLGIDASAKLHGVDTVLAGPLQDLGVKDLRRDLILGVVKPIIDFPKCRRILAKHAAGCIGGRTSPWMDRFQRIILEHNANLAGIEIGDHASKDGRFRFARGTFEIAELNDGDGSVGGAETGLVVENQPVQIEL